MWTIVHVTFLCILTLDSNDKSEFECHNLATNLWYLTLLIVPKHKIHPCLCSYDICVSVTYCPDMPVINETNLWTNVWTSVVRLSCAEIRARCVVVFNGKLCSINTLRSGRSFYFISAICLLIFATVHESETLLKLCGHHTIMGLSRVIRKFTHKKSAEHIYDNSFYVMKN